MAAGSQHMDGGGQFVKHRIDLLGFAQQSQIVGQLSLQLEHFAFAFQHAAECGGQLGEFVLQTGDALDRRVDLRMVVLTVRSQCGDGLGQLVLAVLSFSLTRCSNFSRVAAKTCDCHCCWASACCCKATSACDQAFS